MTWAYDQYWWDTDENEIDAGFRDRPGAPTRSVIAGRSRTGRIVSELRWWTTEALIPALTG